MSAVLAIAETDAEVANWFLALVLAIIAAAAAGLIYDGATDKRATLPEARVAPPTTFVRLSTLRGDAQHERFSRLPSGHVRREGATTWISVEALEFVIEGRES